ncbi:MAG: DUF4981 domain-containing protein [Spirochaetales bacterium]|nr:DUF4981 domain-containing protein [Spirochaetales bacterium]
MGEPGQRKKNLNAAETMEDWQNPRLTGINKRPGGFQGSAFSSVSEALTGDDGSRNISLDGEWSFRWFSSSLEVPSLEQLHQEGRWESIPVPSNWQMQGYDVPSYLNISYPESFDVSHPPFISPKQNPVGWYRRQFSLPDSWREGGDVHLRFEGIRSAARVFLNGKDIGYTQDSYSPAEFVLQEALFDEENTLDVQVFQSCAGAYLEDQDMWRMAGLIRSVSLLFHPTGGIEDVWPRCSFEAADTRFDLTILCAKNGRPGGRIRWALRENGSQDIYASGGPQELVDQCAEFSLPVSSPQRWTAETPHLYTLVVELSDEHDVVLDVRRLEFGFRQIDIRPSPHGAVLTVNGEAVKLRGVNRHDIHPQYGQALPDEQIEADLILLKQHNVNAIRCSHYPNPEVFYQLADRLGFYVIDETNLETHGLRNHIPASCPEWMNNCVERVERMVRNHRSHPSILLWSLGNEAGRGKTFHQMKKAVRALDSTRPVHYEGDHQLNVSDVFSLMYPGVKTLKRIARRKSVRVAPGDGKLLGWAIKPRQYKHKPFILCEFAHCMGNSLGGLSDYMNLIESSPHIAGGFIWDFADQALMKKDDQGNAVLSYGGDFGEKNHDGIFCANGIFTADRQSTPEAQELKSLYAPVDVEAIDVLSGKVALINRQSFASLDGLDIHWTLEREGQNVAEGVVRKTVEPRSKSLVHLYRSLDVFPGKGEGFLTFSFKLKNDLPWAPAGYEIGRRQIPVPEVSQQDVPADAIFDYLRVNREDQNSGKKPDDSKQKITRGEWHHEADEEHLMLASPQLAARFSMKNGALEALDFGRGNLLAQAWEPDFYRAPTDNEQLGLVVFLKDALPEGGLRTTLEKWGTQYAHWTYGKSWESSGRERQVKSWKIEEKDDSLIITFAFKISGFLGTVSLTYTFDSHGHVRMKLRGIPWKPMVRFGTRAAFVARLKEVAWYGLGPQENYRDRQSGALVGLYRNAVSHLSHLYLHPQESGNRGGVRWVAFSDGGRALRIESSQGHLNFSAAPWSRESLEQAAHSHEVSKDDIVHVRIDREQRGVGGSLPGMLSLPFRHRMPAFRPYSLEFTLHHCMGDGTTRS